VHAEQIIDEEVERFSARVEASAVVPTIVSLQDQMEAIRLGEVERMRGKLGSLSPEQEAAVEALTRGIINKILHPPIATLKTAAREREASAIIDLIRRIFNLRDKQDGG
jgi:glutamyl-tRNA reductase